MAIHDNYIDKITKDGESRMISPAADNVRVDNEHYEGDNLDEVLDEIASAIDEAGSGDGTVKGVKVGSTTYDPDSETGVVDLSTPIADKVDKVPGKGLSTNDYTDADQAKLQALPTADGLTQQLSSKANAADVYSKSDVYTKGQVDDIVEDIEAGTTVVINSDGANIVDEVSDSILTAPSSRMMKEIYLNLRALFDPTNGLAGIAFLGAKPTWQTVDTPEHTITLDLTDVTAEFNNESVSGSFDASEGEVTIKLTPAQGKMILANNISIMLGSESVPFTLTTNNGSTLVTFILAGNVTFTAAASSGIGVQVSGNNVSANVQGIPLSGDNRIIVLSHPEHFDWDGSIGLSVNSVALVVNTDYTITDNQDGTKTITILKTFTSDAYPIVIAANAVEDDFAVLNLTGVGNNVSVMRGSENLLEQETPVHVYAGETISILPVGNNKVSATVTFGSSAATLQGDTYDGFTYTLDSNDVSSSGTAIAITAEATALQTFSIDLFDLVGVTSSNDATSILEGSPYSTTLSKTDPTASGSVIIGTCTMGSEPIAVTNNTINITHVTGNITLAATVGVAPMKVHSWGFAPETDNDSKRYLNDSIGDFWLYSQSDAGLNSGHVPSGYYGNSRQGTSGTGVGYGSHRVLPEGQGGDFTVKIKGFEIVRRTDSAAYTNAYLSSQTKIKMHEGGNVQYAAGQFFLKLTSPNASGTTAESFCIGLSYGYNNTEKTAYFDDVMTAVSDNSGNRHDYLFTFDADTLKATCYRVTIDPNGINAPTLDKCGEATVDTALIFKLIAYAPLETTNKGLDIYNYAMSQSDIEVEYRISNNE